MKKWVSLILAAAMCLSLMAPAMADTLTGAAQGFGGEVAVTLTVDGGKITAVEITGANETPGIGTKAIEELPAKIVEANGAAVDTVAGATVTSKAIIAAVEAAMGAGNAAAGFTFVYRGDTYAYSYGEQQVKKQ